MTTNERTDLGLTDSSAGSSSAGSSSAGSSSAGSSSAGSSSAGCSCCATTSGQAAAPASAIGTITADVLVEGMTCSHCVASVTEEIAAIEGVDSVSVDLNAGGTSRVTIQSAAPIDVVRVRAAVEEAGYALAGEDA